MVPAVTYKAVTTVFIIAVRHVPAVNFWVRQLRFPTQNNDSYLHFVILFKLRETLIYIYYNDSYS